MNVSLKPTKYDALVVLLVLALAVSLGARSFLDARKPIEQNGGLTVVVSMDGQEVERTSLLDYSGQHIYENRGYTLTVESADGCVDVTQSDCPNQDCKHSAAITRSGQSIVCLPARISITLVGANPEFDAIAG